MIVRPLYPKGIGKIPVREQSRWWRWIAWDVQEIPREQVAAHLHSRAVFPCVAVYVQRGPKGGWTGALFIGEHDNIPRRSTTHTFYPGWRLTERSDDPRPTDTQLALLPDITTWRAHLALHARP